MNDEQQLIIFEGDAGQVEVRLEGETVWLSLPQMAELFARDKSVISRHLKNIFATGELTREATVAKMQRFNLKVVGKSFDKSNTTTSTPSFQ